MADRDLPSGSDESDDDYIPEGENGNVSEEEDSGDAESETENLRSEPQTKRRRQDPVKTQKTVADKPDSNLDIDSIWADFKKDTEPKKDDVKTIPKDAPTVPAPSIQKPSLLTSKISPVANTSKGFGGGGGGGLSSILQQMGKKNKLTTLEKSKLDWNNFKKAEGIDDELKTHNKGKNGYLERKDFLERADLRQFEIEKQLRSVKRSTR